MALSRRLRQFWEKLRFSCWFVPPGINDPFTATACVGWLAAGLSRRAGRRTPSSLRYDDGNRLRVIARPVGFEELTAASFDPIREYGHGHAMVVTQLFGAPRRIARHARSDAQREVLRKQAWLTMEAASEAVPETHAEWLRLAYDETLSTLR